MKSEVVNNMLEFRSRRLAEHFENEQGEFEQRLKDCTAALHQRLHQRQRGEITHNQYKASLQGALADIEGAGRVAKELAGQYAGRGPALEALIALNRKLLREGERGT
jgi:hypothetical protein